MRPPRVWLLKEGEPVPLHSGAVGLRTAQLGFALERSGCEVSWFTSEFDHGRKARLALSSDRSLKLSDRFSVYFLPALGYSSNVSFRRILHQHWTARMFKKYSRSLPRPDVLIAAYPSPELCDSAREFANRYGLPFIIDVRDPWPDSFSSASKRAGFLLRPLLVYYNQKLRRCLQQSSSIVSMSNTMLKWALNKAGREKRLDDRVFYLGHAENPGNSFRGINKSRFTTEMPLKCAFYGMFGPSHDGGLVIDAARILADKGESRIQIFMAGDGELCKAWRERAKGLANIQFTGWLSGKQADELLGSCDVGINCLAGELRKYWFGIKLSAYLSHGLALVHNVQGELEDLVKQFKLGVTLKNNTADDLAEALLLLANNPELLNSCRERAGNLYRQEFNASEIYKNYARFVLSLMESDVGKMETLEKISLNYLEI